MSKSRKAVAPEVVKVRKQISFTPEVVPIAKQLARQDCRSFSNFLEYLIRMEDQRRKQQVAA